MMAKLLILRKGSGGTSSIAHTLCSALRAKTQIPRLVASLLARDDNRGGIAALARDDKSESEERKANSAHFYCWTIWIALGWTCSFWICTASQPPPRAFTRYTDVTICWPRSCVASRSLVSSADCAVMTSR